MFSFLEKTTKSSHSHEHAGHAHGGGCCGGGGGHDHQLAVDEQDHPESDVVASAADRESSLSASAPGVEHRDTHG